MLDKPWKIGWSFDGLNQNELEFKPAELLDLDEETLGALTPEDLTKAMNEAAWEMASERLDAWAKPPDED